MDITKPCEGLISSSSLDMSTKFLWVRGDNAITSGFEPEEQQVEFLSSPPIFMSYKTIVKDGRREYSGVPTNKVNQLIDDLVRENNALFKEITIVPNNFGTYNIVIKF